MRCLRTRHRAHHVPAKWKGRRWSCCRWTMMQPVLHPPVSAQRLHHRLLLLCDSVASSVGARTCLLRKRARKTLLQITLGTAIRSTSKAFYIHVTAASETCIHEKIMFPCDRAQIHSVAWHAQCCGQWFALKMCSRICESHVTKQRVRAKSFADLYASSDRIKR